MEENKVQMESRNNRTKGDFDVTSWDNVVGK